MIEWNTDNYSQAAILLWMAVTAKPMARATDIPTFLSLKIKSWSDFDKMTYIHSFLMVRASSGHTMLSRKSFSTLNTVIINPFISIQK